MDVVLLNDVEFEVLRVMARYTGPKAKIARKFGENIFGNAKIAKILERKKTSSEIIMFLLPAHHKTSHTCNVPWSN